MTFLYAATEIFDNTCDSGSLSWKEYVEWSRLYQLVELVSLDSMLNASLVDPDLGGEEDWSYVHTYGQYVTGFYTSFDFVFSKLKQEGRFNLLAVVVEPNQDCAVVVIDGYEFVGYDLLDKSFGVSALTNCGGFDETFLPSDLNKYGLVSDFLTACDIKKRLPENNPAEYHANTYLIAVWRHKEIGRKHNYTNVDSE